MTKSGAGEIEVVRRHQAESGARIALGKQVFLGMMQRVPAFAARPHEGADGKGIAGKETVRGTLVVIVVVLDEELDLPGFVPGDDVRPRNPASGQCWNPGCP